LAIIAGVDPRVVTQRERFDLRDQIAAYAREIEGTARPMKNWPH
jgi:hypothetical protein